MFREFKNRSCIFAITLAKYLGKECVPGLILSSSLLPNLRRFFFFFFFFFFLILRASPEVIAVQDGEHLVAEVLLYVHGN